MTTAAFKTNLRERLKDSNANKYFFDDTELTNFATRAVKSLWPRTWIDTYEDIAVSDSNKTSITPATSNVKRIDEIKVLDSSGALVGSYTAFYKVGTTIFPTYSEFPTGYTFRLILSKRYSTVDECPDEFEDYLLDRAELEALRALEMDRSRYYKYTASIRPEGGGLPSLSKLIEGLQQSLKNRMSELAQFRESTQINLTD